MAPYSVHLHLYRMDRTGTVLKTGNATVALSYFIHVSQFTVTHTHSTLTS